ncbi:glycosyltransferase [Allobranchiibius sp. GilTou73]|uniref:CgeB family protein n=1 Tax=Allobranchiibius sp. GilTou73 TaxID=2904523 RepID=UPI001F2677F5|nr:glycosyltransferase [Allobranchiibius sp. GilTou73]UIJ33495.1 glycosyltransferase [Allobranchiibius sp. GilTou73]
MTPRRVLLVSPGFHGYWRAIAAALQDRGHTVDTHVYDAPPSLPGRIANKLLHDLPDAVTPARLHARLTERAIAAVRAHAPQVVVVVKGDLLQDSFWHLLDELRLPRVTWLYDEVRRTRYTLEALAGLGPLATYSRTDAQALGATHLPLGFDRRTTYTPRRESVVTFIGARYPARETALHGLDDAGVPVRAYGRDWSRGLGDRLHTHTLRAARVPSGGQLSRSQAYGVMAGSAATLNLHGDQDGFTMRTFEAAGVGGVQLIDRSDVSELYEVDGAAGEVLVVASPGELREVAGRCVREPRWADGIRDRGRARTLAEHTFDHRATVLESLWA